MGLIKSVQKASKHPFEYALKCQLNWSWRSLKGIWKTTQHLLGCLRWWSVNAPWSASSWFVRRVAAESLQSKGSIRSLKLRLPLKSAQLNWQKLQDSSRN